MQISLLKQSDCADVSLCVVNVLLIERKNP